MNATFTLNDKAYRTDPETLEVLRSIMPSAKTSGDSSAVIAALAVGLKTGRIVMDAPEKRRKVGMYDGSTACPVCSCRVMIPAGSTSKKLRRLLALADHAKALHAPPRWR